MHKAQSTVTNLMQALELRLDLVPETCTTYHVMWQDEPVADVTLSADKKQIHYTKYEPDGLRQPFSGTKLDLERFYRFLKSRCYDDNRADLPEILHLANMKTNNPYEWVRRTHGVTYDDFFWLRFDGEELMWKDVKVR